MTATQSDDSTTLPWHVGDRVQIRHKGQTKPGRITSVHRVHDGVKYVVRISAVCSCDGGTGEVLRIWTSSGSSSFLTALAPTARGGAR